MKGNKVLIAYVCSAGIFLSATGAAYYHSQAILARPAAPDPTAARSAPQARASDLRGSPAKPAGQSAVPPISTPPARPQSGRPPVTAASKGAGRGVLAQAAKRHSTNRGRVRSPRHRNDRDTVRDKPQENRVAGLFKGIGRGLARLVP